MKMYKRATGLTSKATLLYMIKMQTELYVLRCPSQGYLKQDAVETIKTSNSTGLLNKPCN